MDEVARGGERHGEERPPWRGPRPMSSFIIIDGPNANAEWDRSAARGGIQSVRVQRGSSYGRARYGTFGLLTSE